MGRSRITRKNKLTVIIFSICVIISLILTVSDKFFDGFGWDELSENAGIVGNVEISDYPISVHFIDVGQGDCTLVTSEFGNILIDSGENEYKNNVISYLRNLRIEKIDYLIATHPHSDHIGSMYGVVDNFEIGKFYTSELDERDIPTSMAYENLLNSLDRKEVDSSYIEYGDSFELGEIRCEVLAPVETIVGNLNSMSVVLKLTYKDFSVLITGDAEKDEEKSILKTGCNLESDILKVGHHASISSSSIDFLEAVNPKYAVISCGKDNKYSHPHKKTLDKLDNLSIEYFRIDEISTVIFSYDGENIIRN
ncbi:MAG: MBL fold metallo-hydrolase [Clostridia bacterium]|nr:MBL fold metallo-hydrolase [Clostridia bacterium]